MGLDFFLEDEKGREIASVPDPRNLLKALIQAGIDENSQILRFVDPYGNTVFNRLQMAQLLTELEGLRKSAEDPEQLELLRKVEELTRRGQQRPHLYIKIYGD